MLGYLVDLRRIERILESHPAMKAAAVVPVAWRGRDRLVAWAVAPQESAEELSAFLAGTCPAFYLVPDLLICTSELPLAGDVVDRDRLAALGRVPEPQRVFSLRPIGIEVVGSGNAFLDMVQEGLSDLVANPQAGDMNPPRPPEIVGPDVLQTGDLPELPVRILELPRIVVSRRDLPEQRAGAIDLRNAALQDLLDRAFQRNQEVFAILGLGHLPGPLAVEGNDVLRLDGCRFPGAAEGGQDQEVDVRRLLALDPRERLQDHLDLRSVSQRSRRTLVPYQRDLCQNGNDFTSLFMSWPL